MIERDGWLRHFAYFGCWGRRRVSQTNFKKSKILSRCMPNVLQHTLQHRWLLWSCTYATCTYIILHVPYRQIVIDGNGSWHHDRGLLPVDLYNLSTNFETFAFYNDSRIFDLQYGAVVATAKIWVSWLGLCNLPFSPIDVLKLLARNAIRHDELRNWPRHWHRTCLCFLEICYVKQWLCDTFAVRLLIFM